MRGIRLIDLSTGVAGEFCSRLLGGYGAEVIKVEHPRQPTRTRRLPPFIKDEAGLNNSTVYWHLNGGKKGISLDLQSSAGKRILVELVGSADVVVEDFAPGTLDQWGLGYGSLRAFRPDIIMTSITPFGQTGPWSQHRATELGALAAGGELYITGLPDREPIKPYGYLAHYAGGLQGAVATMAALCSRQVTGQGWHIDGSLQESTGMYLTGGPAWVHHFPESQTRVGARVAQAVVRQTYSGNILRCSDGYLWFGTGHNQDMIALLTESPSLDSKELWSLPGPHADMIDEAIEGWTRSRTREEVLRRAQELQIAVAPVLTLDEVLQHPQHQARNFLRSANHPRFGAVLALGAPAEMSDIPWCVDRPPALGEHNQEVYYELLGHSWEEIAGLFESGVL